MAVYIESRFTDGYIAHHMKDEIRIHIVHQPQDGYLLSYDKELIRERFTLKDFLERIRGVEGAQRESLDNEIQRIGYALRERKEREVSEWLDHRYASLIQNKQIILAQHKMSMKTDTKDWNIEKTMKHMDEQGYKVQQPMTYDEAYQKGITDDEIYYLTTL